VIIAESLLVSLLGAAVAIGGSLLIFNGIKFSPHPIYFPVFLVQAQTVAVALAAGVACGLLSSVVPGVRAARRKISDGLRQVV
jgi:ABC-type antimicrobial peptide transport system permease subunit